MIIPARPFPHSTRDRTRPERNAALVQGLTFFPLGRHALLHALRCFEISPGDAILVPASFCESSLGPLRSLGYRICFADVDESMQMALREVDAELERGRVRAAIFVNYFGVIDCRPHLAAAGAGRRGIKLIEDCAHSFLEVDGTVRQPDAGDAVMFSMRKILPVADGGAVAFGDQRLRDTGTPAQRPPAIDAWRYDLVRLIERGVTQIGWPNIYGREVDAVRARLRTTQAGQSPQAPKPAGDANRTGISKPLERYLADPVRLRAVAEKRMKNYAYLSRGLVDSCARVRLLAGSPQLAPQVLPVLDESASLTQFLREHGIGACWWPGDELPEEVRSNKKRFPNAIRLNNTIVCLPVHQDIGSPQLDYMIETVAKWACRR
jgi:dTDP-4-amino-4,6-dideoxygalactose transaminase